MKRVELLFCGEQELLEMNYRKHRDLHHGFRGAIQKGNVTNCGKSP